jgi:hypothetical protein
MPNEKRLGNVQIHTMNKVLAVLSISDQQESRRLLSWPTTPGLRTASSSLVERQILQTRLPFATV